MGYINVDPITKKVKEYKNSGEWIADVEKATSKPKPKQNKNMTFPEASKKLREEFGIDLRTASEKEQAKIDGLIEQKVAEGVSAALARQQAIQSSQVRLETHSSQLDVANAALARIHETQKSLGLIPPKACGCTHSKEAKASKMTYLAAAEKLRKEYGIDLRTLVERQDATTRSLVEKKKAEKKAAALAERPDIVYSSQARQEVHSTHNPQKGEASVHSAYAVGPVMSMERVSWPEAQRRLRAAGVEI